MKEEIRIPQLGESVSSATIASFIVKSGEAVAEGAELVEIETEKVNQILYAPVSGVVTWTVEVGAEVEVGALIGYVEKGAAPPKVEAPPKKEEPKAEVPAPTPTPPPAGEGRLFKEEWIAPKKEEPPVVKPIPVGGVTRKKMSKIRQVIARRLTESLHNSAMLTTFNEVDMSRIIELRTRYQEAFTAKHGVKLGFMSFFVKGVVAALKDFPSLNSFIDGDEIVTPETYDIGIAVGTDRGLVVPVVRDCAALSFAEIEQKIADFAKKARGGGLTVDDLTKGTFTITNGGVYGSLLSTPILNPPQSGILGMHKIEKRAVVIDDTIQIRPMMYLALSYDHRLVDGKESVSFLVKVKEVLEDPARLLFFNGVEGHGNL